MYETRKRRIRLLLRQRDHGEGICAAEALADDYPDRSESFYMLAFAYSASRRWSDATAAISKAILREPGSSTYFAERARYRFMLDDIVGAIEDATFALEIERSLGACVNSPSVRVLLGYSLERAGRFPEALELFESMPEGTMTGFSGDQDVRNICTRIRRKMAGQTP